MCIPPKHIIDIYIESQRYAQNIRDMTNPMRFIEAQESEGEFSDIRFRQLERAYNDVVRSWSKLKPLSFIQQYEAYVAKRPNNTSIENGIASQVLLMESGLRLKESSATTYGDFRSFKDDETIPKVFIHNSTIGQTHNIRDGLKTDSGYRVAIISNKLALLLEEKQKCTEAMICRENTDVTHGITDIYRVPMVHDKNDTFRHCASPQLTAAFRKLFTQVGYNEKNYLLLLNIINSEEFAEAVKRVTPKELGFAEEKDPSAYALRRHFNG